MHRLKRIFIGLTLSSLLFAPTLRGEEKTVPHYLNYQSVLRDDAGNLITDSFIDLEFKILGSDGQELYQEVQPGVQAVRGAVNLMIGEGVVPGSEPAQPTGGLPLTVFDPATGPKSLQIQIGKNRPSDPIELGMVPYAAWAERSLSVAPNSIGSEEIKNGSIKLEDLEPGLAFSDIRGQAAIGQIPEGIATDEELNAHIHSTTAHPASAITISGPFSFSTADNLQNLIQDLDTGLLQEVSNRSLNRDSLSIRIGQEATDRQAAMNAESANRTAADATEAATRATADAAETTARQAGDSDLQSQVSQETTNRTAADATEAATRATADNSLSASIGSEATTRSGADSGLQGQISGHVGTSTAHGSDGAIVGMNTLNNALATEAATRATADSSLQGQISTLNSTTSDINNIPGTLSESKIDPTIARVSQIPDVSPPPPPNLQDLPGQVTTAQVPQFMRPAAFGTITRVGGDNNISNAYNLSSATGFNCPLQVNFSNPLPDANYVVMITLQTANAGESPAGPAYITEKFPSYLTICTSNARAADILVFHP